MSENLDSRESSGLPTWSRDYLLSNRKELVLALALGFLSYMLAILLMFTAGYLISRTAEEGVFLLMVMVPIACVQLFGIGKPLAQYFERFYSHDWVFRVTSDLRARLFAALDRQATDQHSPSTFGQILGMLADDIGHFQNLYLRVILPTLFAYLVMAVVFLVLNFFSFGYAMAMLIVLGVLALAVPQMYAQAIRIRSLTARAISRSLYDDLTDNVFGTTDWILSGRSGDFAANACASTSTLRSLNAKIRSTQRVVDFFSMVILGFGAWLTVLWAGNQFGSAGSSEYSLIAAFVFGFFPLIEVFSPLNGATALIDQQYEALARIDAIAFNDQPLDENADLNVIENDQAIHKGISIENMSFAYDGANAPTISSMDLTIPFGQHVAIIGRSGSGKSTLANLLCGFLKPTCGSVIVNGHVPLPPDERASLDTVYVEQNPHVFNRTLRDNLTLGVFETNDEELSDVLSRVGLARLLESLPQGLDTLVDEQGMRFSGGERHRIALARTLLAQADTVILDEPTVGLDPQTESSLFDTVFDVCADKTLVVITHHLAEIERFDRVICIEDGSVAFDDSPTSLASENAHFKKLLDAEKRALN